jgi:hypothetical protein
MATNDPRIGAILSDRQAIGGSSLGKFDQNKYKVSNLMYPSDLMSDDNRYSGSYVVFYLNVNQDSKLLKDPNNVTVDDESVAQRRRGKMLSTESSGVGTAATVGALGAGAGGLGGSIGLGNKGKKAAAIGGIAGIVAVAAIGTQTSTFSRTQKRLEAAIALHVPNQLNIRYGANWEAEDTDMFSMVQEGGEAMVNAFKSASSGVASANSLKDGAIAFGNAAAGFGGKIGTIAASLAFNNKSGVNVPQAVQGLTGLAPNPRKEQFFKGIDFRTFTFQYQFYPKSAEEARNVQNIIYLFKLHMLPEFKDSGNFLYIYPSEFDIAYYHNHEENLNVHRHTSCVLTEMNVQYTPNGQFTTFEDGTPTQINVDLTFKELALVTKENVQEGL